MVLKIVRIWNVPNIVSEMVFICFTPLPNVPAKSVLRFYKFGVPIL